jgi:antitoxin (DNA-binding transcriptional repressor) of toxin-antitoxin stability system
MAELKTVGIKELKNNLSAYLREVRRGTRLLVADRSTIIAELHEPGAAYHASEEENAILTGWVRDGIVKLPTRPREPLPSTGLELEPGTAARLIEEDRGRGAR